jgi:tetratricopeptide (TPR) repeat protein
MIPQPKYGEIIDKLNAIGQILNRKPLVFELNRYKNEAKLMLKSSPVEANLILGAISSLENNIKLMHKFHKIALYESNNSRFALYQYAISLSNTNRLDESYDYFLKAYNAEEHGSDLTQDGLIIQNLMEMAYFLHKDNEYTKYKSMLEKLKIEFIDPDHFIEDDEKILDKMFSMTDKNMKKNPHLIKNFDPALIKEIEELIDGVELP